MNKKTNKIDAVPIGKYQHFKNNNFYQVIGVALHSETLEEMVIYRALYDSNEFTYGQIWTRPKSMFLENITHHGKVMPRFKLIEITN